MSSSNDIEKNPGEISTVPAQPTPETGTNTDTTDHNNEFNDKNSGDDSKKSPPVTTTDKGDTCFTILDRLRKKYWPNKADSAQSPEDGSITSRIDNSRARMQHRLKKLEKQIKQTEDYVEELANFQKSACYEGLQTQLKYLREIVEKESEASPSKASVRRIAEINKDIMKITKHLSSPETMSKKVSLSDHLQPGTASSGSSAVHELVNVYQSTSLRNSSFHKEIQNIFESLDQDEKKFILSCFTVFPENAVVKRRIFVFWGVGEGFLDAEAGSPEKIVYEILEEFQQKGLIEHAIKKRKLQLKSYKMHPLVRSAVILISKFFEYDGKGNVLPQRYWTPRSVSKGDQATEVEVNVSFPQGSRMCLLKAEELDQEQEQEQLLKRTLSIQKESQPTSTLNSATDLEKLVTLFNVNEPFPDLELAWLTKMKDKNGTQLNKEPRAVDWLSKMKNAKVVCLGNWPGSSKSHIEVESTEFFEGLTKELRFFSLQGVSRIIELPESIGNNSKLMILDLKECHNLEVLPKEIAKLTDLRYLDLSDCYLLARLPKELSALVKLRVLKGFVINPQRKGSATLHDLKKLNNLRKLTINANSKDFPTDDDLSALKQIGGEGRALRNLTIAWGATTLADKQGEAQNGGDVTSCWKVFKAAQKQPNQTTVTNKLPEQLEKLDLQCFPKSTATWLTPKSLLKLEKLYIRGGNLATLDRSSKWSMVRALRLKYLRELKMNWREMKDSFPDLEYLEKVKCPGITLCPCDQHGVWMKNPEQK